MRHNPLVSSFLSLIALMTQQSAAREQHHISVGGGTPKGRDRSPGKPQPAGTKFARLAAEGMLTRRGRRLGGSAS